MKQSGRDRAISARMRTAIKDVPNIAMHVAALAVEVDAVTTDKTAGRFPFTATAAASNDHGTLQASSACWLLSGLMNFLHDADNGAFVLVAMNVVYLRGMPTGRRGIAVLREVKRGRSFTFYDLKITDAVAGDTYVTATAQFATPRLAKL
jgi:acyl-coenzyme A thioesterase PaaI-like protein